MRRHLTARDLGFTVEPGDEAALFKWLLASMLFGHRIAQTIAARTWRALVDAGIDTPHALAGSRHAALVRMLGEGATGATTNPPPAVSRGWAARWSTTTADGCSASPNTPTTAPTSSAGCSPSTGSGR